MADFGPIPVTFTKKGVDTFGISYATYDEKGVYVETYFQNHPRHLTERDIDRAKDVVYPPEGVLVRLNA